MSMLDAHWLRVAPAAAWVALSACQPAPRPSANTPAINTPAIAPSAPTATRPVLKPTPRALAQFGRWLCLLVTPKTVRCAGPTFADSPVGVPPGEHLTGIGEETMDLHLATPSVVLSGGARMACTVGENGRVFCFGYHAWLKQQLDGHGSIEIGREAEVDLPERAVDVAIGGEFACALLEGGDVFCWGNDLGTVIGDVNIPHSEAVAPLRVALGARAVSVTAAHAHACALLEGGQVKCWGNRDDGLGLGPRADAIAPWQVKPDSKSASVPASAVRPDHPAVVPFGQAFSIESSK